MMSKKRAAAVLAVPFVGVMLLLLVFGMVVQPRAQAAPLPAPTPVSSDATAAGKNPVVTFWKAKALTANGASNVIELPDMERMDLQWVVDVGTVNTTTIKLQYSNDGTNWVDGVNVEASIAADKNNLQQFNNFGRYTRLYATLTNSSPITITAIAVGK